MLKTFDRTHWVEDPLKERVREKMGRDTPVQLLRDHYPFTCVVTRDIPVYGLKAGQVLQYARTLYEPNLYPVECIVGVEGETHSPLKPRRIRLHSMEVVVCEV